MNTDVVKPVRYGDQIEMEITSLAFGGDAVGRFQDFAIFVTGGLPGERVRVKITHVRDHFANGEILSVLRHSPDRVAPVCPIFEECGGCQWQHLSYPAQLKTKRQFVVDALARIGHLTNVTVQPCLPSPSPYAYRNKALPVVSMRDGHFVSGIYEPRSHHLVPYHTCPIQADALNDLIQKVLLKVDRSGLTPYQDKKHTGFLRHLAVRQGVKTGEILLAFVTRTDVPEERLQKPTVLLEELDQILPRIARELMEETPGLVGVLQNLNPSRTNMVFGPKTRVLEGRDHYFEVIDSLQLKVSLTSFLQVNTHQADILHALVREALGQPTHQKKWGTVLDLYSGIGTLGLAVSENADYVVGVEEVGEAVEDAKANALLNQKTNIDYLEGDVAKVLLGLKDKGFNQVDAVIMDPPRKGMLPEVLARLTAFRPERLVYVSCDPATLARDLALLTKHGYTVDWVQPLDMFPQTYHVETVVKLTRETPIPSEVLSQASQPALEPFRPAPPLGPASQNISASPVVLREKTSTFLAALGQAGKAGAGLLASLFLAFFTGVARGVAAAGRGTASLIRSAGESASKAGGKLSELTQGTAKDIQHFTQTGSEATQSQFLAVQEKTSSLKDKFTLALKEKTGESLETTKAVQPVEEEPLASSPEILEAPETKTEEEVIASIISSASPIETSPWVETAPVSAEPSELGENKEEASPVTTQRFGEAAENPLESALEASVAPTVEPARPVPTVVSEPLAPLPPKPAWKLPSISIPWGEAFSWLGSRRTLRWALAAAFLAGGGFIAKATLGPDTKKTSVLVPTVSQMIPDIIAVMPTHNFLRYEMVPFEVRVNAGDMPNFNEMRVVAEVYRGGEAVPMVDGRFKLVLKKDKANGRFVGNWPIPYNPEPGTYHAEVVVSAPQWTAPKTFESAFTIAPLKPSGLYPGYAGLTMEGGKQLVNGAIPALDGSDSYKAANAIDWAKFMGANLYAYLLGQTSIWDHLNPKEFPFSPGDYETGMKYAKAAHEAGLKFAAYMTTFKVVGDAWNQAPYEFSLGYDPDTDQVVQTRFISLNDKKRRQDVIDLLKKLDQEESVDIVGLDYVRTGFAGYEMVDEFVKDLNVPGPADYWTMPKEDRIHWLAKTVELKENKEVVALFEWWRAHKVALALKSILDEAKMTKPVFTFTLGWQQGHEHGQDPAMFVDAGVNFNHIMLYEGDRNTLESMKRQWPDYLSRGNGMYAMGEMVDFNWVQKSLDPPGPEELYNREVETFNNWFAVNANLGMFWHDLYRIVYGIRGPYSSMEWVIAGGKAFTTLQQAEGLCPLEVSISAPKDIPAGVPVPISVTVRNHSPENLTGIVLHQLDTAKDYYTDLATVGPFDLPAGNLVKVKSLFVEIPKEDHPERANRYMTAVMVEKPGQPLRAFDFDYLRKISSSRPVRHTDEASAQDATETGSTDKPGAHGDN